MARTRNALMRAAERLFAARPPDTVTIDELSEAADVAKASFYNHFKGKGDLVQAVAEDIRQDNSALITRANRGVTNPASRIARALCVNARYAAEHRDRAAVLIRYFEDFSTHYVVDAPRLAPNLFRDIDQGLREQIFQDVRPEVGIMLVVGITNETMEAVLEKQTDAAMIAELAAGLLRSLGVARASALNMARRAVTEILDDATLLVGATRTARVA